MQQSSSVQFITRHLSDAENSINQILTKLSKSNIGDARQYIADYKFSLLTSTIRNPATSILSCATRFAEALSRIQAGMPGTKDHVSSYIGNRRDDPNFKRMVVAIEGLLQGNETPYVKVGLVLEWFKKERAAFYASGAKSYGTNHKELQVAMTNLLFDLGNVDRLQSPASRAEHDVVKSLYRDPDAPSYDTLFATHNYRPPNPAFYPNSNTPEEVAKREVERAQFFEQSNFRRQALERMTGHDLFYVSHEWSTLIGNQQHREKLITRHAPMILWLHHTMENMTEDRWKNERSMIMRSVQQLDMQGDINQAHASVHDASNTPLKRHREDFQRLKTSYPEDSVYQQWFDSTLKSTAKMWRILRRYRIRTLHIPEYQKSSYNIFRPNSKIAENVPIGDITDRARLKGPTDLVFGFFRTFKDEVVVNVLQRSHPAFAEAYERIAKVTSIRESLGIDEEEGLKMRIQMLQSEFQRLSSGKNDLYLEIPPDSFDLNM